MQRDFSKDTPLGISREIRRMEKMKMNQQNPHCDEKQKAHLYKIGMFANMNRVSIKTLRYYDEQKLLKPVYAVLLNYMEENGYEICGNIRESYIDGVWNKETAEEWLTEIQIPVRRN